MITYNFSNLIWSNDNDEVVSFKDSISFNSDEITWLSEVDMDMDYYEDIREAIDDLLNMYEEDLANGYQIIGYLCEVFIDDELVFTKEYE